MENFFDKFKLHTEKEDLQTVIVSISNGVVFRGTKLWVLIFAIFVASLGLNVNSAAVIIGAMLISPLMGPIMGIGLGMGISDIQLLRKAVYNYGVATIVALTTSTLFFLISPLDDAHSEILARTSPTIYDVLIALFGGFAGIIATASKQKGNVITGVAIATALMPPLCTAGYGIATLQLGFFVGAFYLYIINTVFIALATLIIVRFLHFPYKHEPTLKAEKTARRIVWVVVLVTLLPSIYFGYDMVQRNRFTAMANNFIANEAHFPNDYLLNKKIDAKNRKITLVFGGKQINDTEIEALRKQLKKYKLDTAILEIKQGFAYLSDNNKIENEELDQLSKALALKDQQQQRADSLQDSVKNHEQLSKQLYAELKTQYPALQTAIVQPSVMWSDSVRSPVFLVLLSIRSRMPAREQAKLESWLKVRLQQQRLKLIVQ